MKKISTSILLLFLCFSLVGCASMNAKRQFAVGANKYAKQILPEYKSYIDKDAELDDDSKRIRKKTADDFQFYIEEGIK